MEGLWTEEVKSRRIKLKCSVCGGENPYVCDCAREKFFAKQRTTKKKKLEPRKLTDEEAEQRWNEMRGVICSFSLVECATCNDGSLQENCACAKEKWIAWIKENERTTAK